MSRTNHQHNPHIAEERGHLAQTENDNEEDKYGVSVIRDQFLFTITINTTIILYFSE